MSHSWTLPCLYCEIKEGLKIATGENPLAWAQLVHAKHLHFSLQGQISIPSSDFVRRPPRANPGCVFFGINLLSSGVLGWPQSVHQSDFHRPLSLCLIPSSCKYWFSAQQTSWDYSSRLGLICSEVGGLEGHEAEMLTKCIFQLTRRFLRVSRASYLLHSFISTMGGLCSPACWWSLLFSRGYSEIKGPIYLQFLCYCRTSFFVFFYLEENYNLGAATLKVKIYVCNDKFE